MTIRLEALEQLPNLNPAAVSHGLATRGPRIKKNPDGKMCHAKTVKVQSNKLWLIVITHAAKPALRYRARVWLRRDDESLIEIEDKDDYYTERGAEWGAFTALTHIIRDLRTDRIREEAMTGEGGHG